MSTDKLVLPQIGAGDVPIYIYIDIDMCVLCVCVY